ncbi:anthocyanidin 3-O-glucosyltransferase 7-like [Phoenix dactylifera]|uniref:Glycosyltransferase n=1 Tax=Phoenix dactylifera TaxID=42345 RepID=A0A8B7CM69_PHODC|nr:anthocyanidin 3-O-glucosyltransferase 7-like [Phoenix dactylifera]
MRSDERRWLDAPHVALLAFPFGTHAAPLFSLARALAAAAPGAAFSFFNSARSNASIARSTAAAGPAPENLRVYDVADGCPTGYEIPADDPEEEVRVFLGLTPANFREKMAAADGGRKVSCLMSDAFLWFAEEMAEEMGVPWVPLWTGGPASLAAHLHTDLLRLTIGAGKQDVPARADEHLNFVPGLSSLRVRDLPEGVVFGNLNSEFSRLLHRMADKLPRAAAVALNTFAGLDPALDVEFAARFNTSLPIGPLNLLAPSPPEPDRHACLPWLDRQAPSSVAYVSFGTVISLPTAELAELAAGLEASGAPFLWSLKDECKERLPVGFLDRTGSRGLLVPWAPQVEVLGHVAVGAFVTHCGWNSVVESLEGGVPMLCRPFLGDQRINARVVSHVWKIGIGFEGGTLTCSGVEEALDVILKTEEGKRMRERAGKLRNKAVRAIDQDGSSVQNFKALVRIATGN